MIGVMSILAYAIASMSNFGFQSMRHIRIGSDLLTIQNLVEMTLARPQTEAEKLAKRTVCKSSITNMPRYTGLKVDNIGVVDSQGKSVLTAISLNNGTNDYTLTARMARASDGPITFDYPDENGVMTKMNYYLTDMELIGTKSGTGNLGGPILHTRVGLSIISKLNGDFFDCSLNTIDPKKVCELLGGKYNDKKDPKCLFTKLPVATDWSKFEIGNPAMSIVPPGAIYGENVIMLGDKDRAKRTFDFWGGANAKGVYIGGLNDLSVYMGQAAGGETGVGIGYQNASFLNLFADPRPPGFWGGLFPQGISHIRSYLDRPIVVATCAGNSCTDLQTFVTKTNNNMTVTHAPIISGSIGAADPFIRGGKSISSVDNAAVAALFNDGKYVGLGRTSDAMGTFFMNETNLPGRPNAALGGLYWATAYTSPGASVTGGLVMKAYGGNDLIFQTTQYTNPAACGPNNERCTRMIIRGATGNVNIGGGISGTGVTPPAKLSVVGNTTSGWFENTVISAKPGDEALVNTAMSTFGNDPNTNPGFVVVTGPPADKWSVALGRAWNSTGGIGLGVGKGNIPKGTIFFETNPAYDRWRIQGYNKNIFLDTSGNPNSTQPILGLLSSSRRVSIDIDSPDLNAQYKLDVNGDINARGALRAATNIFAGGVNICDNTGCTPKPTPSDVRLKENIVPLNNSLEKLLLLHGKSYVWKDPSQYGQGSQIGFIAQEVEKVYPEVVKTDKQTGIKGVAYQYLVAPIIEALRSLVARLEAIEDKVMKLVEGQKKIQKLEEENAMLKAYLCDRDPNAGFCNSNTKK